MMSLFAFVLGEIYISIIGGALLALLSMVKVLEILLIAVMMETPVAESFSGVPEQYIIDFKKLMGITYTYGDYTATTSTHVLVLVGTTLLFLGLALLNVSKKQK